MVRPVSCLAACCFLLALMLAVPTSAYPSPANYYRDEGQYDQDDIVDLLNDLRNLLQMRRKMDIYKDDISSVKRGLDLGLSRGYSGALHGKHLMGIAAANFAGGPGRRRRDTMH